MKRLLYPALIVCAFISCRKQGAPAPKEILLSKISDHNKVKYEFEYTTDNRLRTMKKYYNGSPVITTYEYNNGSLSQAIKTNIYGVPVEKIIYEWNNSGQMIKRTHIDIKGADSGKIVYYTSFTYNAKKQVIKVNNYLGDDTPGGYQTMEYADNGNILLLREYGEKPAGSILVYEWEYKGGTNRISPGIRKAWVEPFEKELPFFDATEIIHTTYEDGSVDTKYKYSMMSRKSEIPGHMSEQHMTYAMIDPVVWPAGEQHAMTYEYIEQ